jgi:hypothetical protein
MGVVIRSPASRKIEKDDCRCFILGKDNYLCFRRNFTGALSDDQEQKYCTAKSFEPEKKGGFAKEVDSEESQNILRTIGMFTKGVKVAKKEYEESGQRSIPYWQNVVKHKVDDVYLHPGDGYQHAEKATPENSGKSASPAQIREKITKVPAKTVEKHPQEAGSIDWEGNKRRRMEKEKRTLPTKTDEEVDERIFITPETVRALDEAHKKRFNPLSNEEESRYAGSFNPMRDETVDRILSLSDYRYNRFED